MTPFARLPRFTLVVMACLVLAGCGSSRFAAPPRSGPPLPPPSDRGIVYNTPGGGQFGAEEPVYQPGPVSAPVIASPLPPPSGGLQGGPGGFNPDDDGQVPVGRSDPTIGQSQVVARANPTAPQTLEPVTAPPATRSSVIGSWTMRDGTGASCRVQLSSSPALDLYKASATGCANKDLARVTAWDHRDGEVYLYQPGGTVIARLRQGGAGFSGVMTKSGATLAMNR